MDSADALFACRGRREGGRGGIALFLSTTGNIHNLLGMVDKSRAAASGH
jgi:hypothetical protein